MGNQIVLAGVWRLNRRVHTSGGVLFPRGKSTQKRAKTKVFESFPVDKRFFGKTRPKLSIVSRPAPLPLIFQNVGAVSPIAGRRGRRPLRIDRQTSSSVVGAGVPDGPNERTPHPLHFERSAAAAQKIRRSYISCPLHGTPQPCGTHLNNLPMRGARLGSQETLVSCGVLWVLSFAEERKYPAGGIPTCSPKNKKMVQSNALHHLKMTHSIVRVKLMPLFCMCTSSRTRSPRI